MSRLFLTSAGFVNRKIGERFILELGKPVSDTRILIVAYAKNPKEEFFVNESKKEIEELGFKNIDVVNMQNDVDVPDLSSPDVIYVCGGNTFAILNKLRETGLDKFIIEKVNSGVVYVGVSAGSIIAGPNIEIAGWGSEGDKNEIGLEDLTGFQFADIAVFPHYHEELKSEVLEFKNKVNYRVEPLTNDQAIFVNGDNEEIL